MRLLSLLILLYSASTQASFRFGLSTAALSRELVGFEIDTSREGRLVSDFQPRFGVHIDYGFAKRFHLLVNHYSRNFAFDNSNEIISGETNFATAKTELGLKVIVHPRVAFRLLGTSDEEMAFKVNDDNQAEVFVEKLSYLRLIYDQVVFFGRSMYSGFKLGYDFSGSGDLIQNRTGSRYGVFAVIHQFEINYIVHTITKSTSTLDFEDGESLFNLRYNIRF